MVQTENDIDNNIHNLHGKLSPDLEKNADPDHLLQTIQVGDNNKIVLQIATRSIRDQIEVALGKLQIVACLLSDYSNLVCYYLLLHSYCFSYYY